MAVEPAGEMGWVADLHCVVAEQAMQDLPERALARALQATEHDRHFGVDSGYCTARANQSISQRQSLLFPEQMTSSRCCRSAATCRAWGQCRSRARS